MSLIEGMSLHPGPDFGLAETLLGLFYAVCVLAFPAAFDSVALCTHSLHPPRPARITFTASFSG